MPSHSRGLEKSGKKALGVGHRVVTWPEALSIFAAVGAAIAALGAAGSFWVAYKAYCVAALWALPRPDIGWESSSTGHRSLAFTTTRASNNAGWVVTSATIRGNWRRRRYLARGLLVHVEEFGDDIIESYEPTGPWGHCVIFDPPVPEGAIVLHPEAPDCEVKLKLVLRTLPSPKVVRRIMLKRYRP